MGVKMISIRISYKNVRDCLEDMIGRSVTHLDLSRQNLRQLPAEIGKLKQLVSLDLSGNNLTTLPSEIQNLKQLKLLNLRGNRIETLPIGIGELSMLRTLDVYGNRLSNLPVSFGGLQLVFLNLQKNRFTYFPTPCLKYNVYRNSRFVKIN